MICLAFVPVDDVTFAFEELRKEDPSEELESLAEYFEDIDIGACQRNRRVKQNRRVGDINRKS